MLKKCKLQNEGCLDDGALVLHLPLQLERPWEQALNFGSICKETGIYGIACASINLFLPSERLQSNMLPYDTRAFTGKILFELATDPHRQI